MGSDLSRRGDRGEEGGGKRGEGRKGAFFYWVFGAEAKEASSGLSSGGGQWTRPWAALESIAAR
jgi:hypothetical protein